VRLTCRYFWLLACLGWSCHRQEVATLVRVEPSTVQQRELPRTVTLVGRNFSRQVPLRLGHRGRPHSRLPRVLLNDESVEVVGQPSADRLTVKLPENLEPGRYDLALVLARSSITLTSALSVEGNGSSIDAAATPAGEVDAAVNTTHSNADATASPATDETASRAPGATSGADSSPERGSTSESSLESSTRPPPTSLESSESPGTNGEPTEPELSGDTSSDSSSSETHDTPDSGSNDAGADDPSFPCAPGEFGVPEIVSVQGYSAARLYSPTLSADGLTMYFTDGSNGSGKLMRATRTERTAAFVDAVYIPALFPSGAIGTPYLMPDGLALYFYSIQGPAMDSRDIYVATRTSLHEDFTMPKKVPGLNSKEVDHLPWVSPDELWIIFISQREATTRYWTSTRSDKNAPFPPAKKLTSLSSTGTEDGRAFVTRDGNRVYFVSGDRPGGPGADDIWYATRESAADEFSDITPLAVVNTPDDETDVTLTQDGEELFFVRTGTGNTLYRSVANCR
jgi:hypothetical protein